MIRSGNIYINRTITMKIYTPHTYTHFSSHTYGSSITKSISARAVLVCMYLCTISVSIASIFGWISSIHPFNIVSLLSRFAQIFSNCYYFVRFLFESISCFLCILIICVQYQSSRQMQIDKTSLIFFDMDSFHRLVSKCVCQTYKFHIIFFSSLLI